MAATINQTESTRHVQAIAERYEGRRRDRIAIAVEHMEAIMFLP